MQLGIADARVSSGGEVQITVVGSNGGTRTAKNIIPFQSSRDWLVAVAAVSSVPLLEIECSQEEIQQFYKEEGLFRNDPSQRLLESLPKLLEKDPLAKKVREVIYKFNNLAKDPGHRKSTPRPWKRWTVQNRYLYNLGKLYIPDHY